MFHKVFRSTRVLRRGLSPYFLQTTIKNKLFSIMKNTMMINQYHTLSTLNNKFDEEYKGIDLLSEEEELRYLDIDEYNEIEENIINNKDLRHDILSEERKLELSKYKEEEEITDEFIKTFMKLKDNERRKIRIKEIEGHIYQCSKHKYASLIITNNLHRRLIYNNDSYDIDKVHFEGLKEYEGFIYGYLKEEQLLIFEEIYPYILELSNHIYGKFIIYHLLKTCDNEQLKLIFNKIKNNILELSLNGGSMIIERFLILSNQNKKDKEIMEFKNIIFKSLEKHLNECIENPLSGFIIERFLMNDNNEEIILKIIKVLQNNLLYFSKHKLASRFIEICLLLKNYNLILFETFHSLDFLNLSTNYISYHIILTMLNNLPHNCRKKIFNSLQNNYLNLTMDKYGSRVVEELLKYGYFQKPIINELKGYIFNLSNNIYSSHIVKNNLININTELVVKELLPNILELSKNNIGSKVIEKLLNKIGTHSNTYLIEQVLNEFKGKLVQLSKDTYGTFVVQRILLTCVTGFKDRDIGINLFKEVIEHSLELSCHPFGCFTIQFLLRRPEVREIIFKHLFIKEEENGKMGLDKQKLIYFASNEYGYTVIIEYIKFLEHYKRNLFFKLLLPYKPLLQLSKFGSKILSTIKQYDVDFIFNK
ncbi:hypothetical protein ABK040_009387 [Willaertia magna]